MFILFAFSEDNCSSSLCPPSVFRLFQLAVLRTSSCLAHLHLWLYKKEKKNSLICVCRFITLFASAQSETFNLRTLRAVRVLRPLKLVSGIPSMYRSVCVCTCHSCVVCVCVCVHVCVYMCVCVCLRACALECVCVLSMKLFHGTQLSLVITLCTLMYVRTCMCGCC